MPRAFYLPIYLAMLLRGLNFRQTLNKTEKLMRRD